MSDTDREQVDGEAAGGRGFVPSGRTVLVLGAAAASTVITVRPALAQTAGSVLNCEIPVPGPHAGGNYIAPDGNLVPPGTQGAAPPLARPLRGEEAKQLLRGTTPAGVNPQSAQAYANYIRRLQSGMSGFTCYASLQMPRLSLPERPLAGPRYIADPAEAVRSVELDGLSALFHAPSGMTHIVAAPAPEILAMLRAGPADAAELLRRLQAHYDFEGDEAAEALHARLEELEAAGLVRRA